MPSAGPRARCARRHFLHGLPLTLRGWIGDARGEHLMPNRVPHLQTPLEDGNTATLVDWYAQLLAATRDAVVCIGNEGRIVLFNAAAEQILGGESGEGGVPGDRAPCGTCRSGKSRSPSRGRGP